MIWQAYFLMNWCLTLASSFSCQQAVWDIFFLLSCFILHYVLYVLFLCINATFDHYCCYCYHYSTTTTTFTAIHSYYKWHSPGSTLGFQGNKGGSLLKMVHRHGNLCRTANLLWSRLTSEDQTITCQHPYHWPIRSLEKKVIISIGSRHGQKSWVYNKTTSKKEQYIYL